MNNRYRGVQIAAILVVFLVGVAVGYLVRGVQTKNPAAAAQTCPYATISTDSLLVELNDYRLSKGLPQLYDDPSLKAYAAARAEEMAASGLLTHTTKYGTYFQWAATQSIPRSSVTQTAEDIEDFQTNACTSILDFEQSPSHNDTVLNPDAVAVGIGYDSGFVVLEIGNK